MRLRTASVALVAVGAALVLAACGNTIDSEDLEGKLATELSADAGVDPDGVSVSCPDDEEADEGNEFECALTAPEGDELTVEVRITDEDGRFEAFVPPQQPE